MEMDSSLDLNVEKPNSTEDVTSRHHGQAFDVPVYFRRKAIVTRIIGAILLVVFAPVILLLVVLVRSTSRGPGLFCQKRVGRHGHEFMMFKIRTMVNDAESVMGPTWCQPGDSRITPIGKVLRFLHLDELPQLFNIVRGEMDLVGPRPERPEFVEMLAAEIPDYPERLDVLPGVTGLAQINLPPDVSIDCVRRKLRLDLEYIHTATLGLDVRILLCTLLRMLGVRYGYAVRVLALGRDWGGAGSNTEQPIISSTNNPSPASNGVTQHSADGSNASGKFSNNDSSDVAGADSGQRETTPITMSSG